MNKDTKGGKNRVNDILQGEKPYLLTGGIVGGGTGARYY